MTLTEYIGYTCFVLFIIYWLTLNFFSGKKTPPTSERPKIKPITFLKQSGSKISKNEAKDLITKR